MKLNEKQIDLVKSKLSELFRHDELCYGHISYLNEDGIGFYVFERYRYNFKAIYVIVPIKLDEQFDRLQELKKIAIKICKEKNANFTYYSVCQFLGDEIVYIAECDYQYFNIIKPK